MEIEHSKVAYIKFHTNDKKILEILRAYRSDVLNFIKNAKELINKLPSAFSMTLFYGDSELELVLPPKSNRIEVYLGGIKQMTLFLK